MDEISRQRQPFQARPHVNANPELRAGDVNVRSRAYARAAPGAAALTLAEHSSTLKTVMAGWPVHVHCARTRHADRAARMRSDSGSDHEQIT